MIQEHAILAPSSAHRWVQCPGSVAMEAAFPELEESESAKEGTAAHWVCEQTFIGSPPAEGSLAPNGMAVTGEMLDGAEVWCATMPTRHAPFPIHIERRVDCPRIHSECWGTPDAFYFDEDAGVVAIRDYKFGHRHVPVYENQQLMTYAAGILDHLQINGFTEQSTTVEFVVVQPRDFHADGPVRTWRINASALRGYFNILTGKAIEAMGLEARLVPSPDACRDCKARHACVAAQTEAAGALDTVYGHVMPRTPSPVEMGKMLQKLDAAIDMAKAYRSGLEEEAKQIIRRGERVPGWSLQAGQGRERWARPIGEVIALGEMMGISVSQPGAITPKQAIKAGLSAEVVRAYSETPTGEVKLVPMERIEFNQGVN